MTYLKRLLRIVKNPYHIFSILATKYDRLHWMRDETLLKLVFRGLRGRKLDLVNPRTFNEKLQWLKLYDRQPEYTDMVDKYNVRSLVARTIGEEYLISLLGKWDSFDDIDFSNLPNQFVLKCTHDSGSVLICKDKSTFDFENAKKRFEFFLKRKPFYYGREWPYKNITPKIIAESFMKDEFESELIDYKLMCFNGKVKCIFVCSDRFSKEGLHITILDRNWNVLPVRRPSHPPKESVPKPLNYSKMVEFAEKFSKEKSFLRVDFYEINQQLYFGELTFYPSSGFERFEPEEWDRKFGDMLTLPSKRI